MTTYTVDLTALTVLATDEHGETYDLNARGEPCRTVGDLRAFIRELYSVGAFDADTMAALLVACA